MHHRRPRAGHVVDGDRIAALAADEQQAVLAETRRGDALRLDALVLRAAFRVVPGADEGVFQRGAGLVPDVAVVVEQGKAAAAAFLAFGILVVALVGGRQ